MSKIAVIAHDNFKPNLLEFLKEKNPGFLVERLLLREELLNF